MYVGVHEADQLNSSLNCDEGENIYNFTVFNMAAVHMSVCGATILVLSSLEQCDSCGNTAFKLNANIMVFYINILTEIKKIPLTSLYYKLGSLFLQFNTFMFFAETLCRLPTKSV